MFSTIYSSDFISVIDVFADLGINPFSLHKMSRLTKALRTSNSKVLRTRMSSTYFSKRMNDAFSDQLEELHILLRNQLLSVLVEYHDYVVLLYNRHSKLKI